MVNWIYLEGWECGFLGFFIGYFELYVEIEEDFDDIQECEECVIVRENQLFLKFGGIGNFKKNYYLIYD